MLKTICIIIVIIAIGAVSIKIYLSSKENKAIQIAQEYLNQKYEQEMQYENVRYSWIDPSLYHVRFSPVSKPEIIFEVLVYPDLTIPEDRWEFGQSKKSADNYYVKYFEYCMEKFLIADVTRLWGDKATVKVLDVNIGGVAFSVSSELNDKITLMEMEPLIDDYWIYVRMNEIVFDELSTEKTANLIFEFIETIKNYDFVPKTIDFWHPLTDDNEFDIALHDWDEIKTVDQVVERIEAELGK